MKKISQNKILIFILTFVLLFPTVRADATIGNINSFIYSNDYFQGDYRGVNNIAQYFRNVGMSAVMTERPNIIYGVQQYFKNSESVYISTHGTEDGGELVLDNSNASKLVLFKSSDVPKNMDCKLAYLSACYSAKTNVNTRKNLCSMLISNGYQATIGYTEAVSNTIAKEFEREFYSHLAKGESVYSSLDSTEKYMSETYRWTCEAFLSSVQPFGNQGLTLE